MLKAKIKKTSIHYKMGLNQKGKSLWLTITGFKTHTTHNFRIRAIKGIKDGFAEYQDIWVKPDEITLKQHEDRQLNLDIFSPQEFEEQKHNPRYFNQRRFEVITSNEKQFIYAPNIEEAEKILKSSGISNYKIKQVKRLTKKELNE